MARLQALKKDEIIAAQYESMALMKKIPTFDDLVFLPGTLTRFVIEGYREKCETKTVIGPRCENPIELDIPVYNYRFTTALLVQSKPQRSTLDLDRRADLDKLAA